MTKIEDIDSDDTMRKLDTLVSTYNELKSRYESIQDEIRQEKINSLELEQKLNFKLDKVTEEKDEAVNAKDILESQIESLQDQIDILNNMGMFTALLD